VLAVRCLGEHNGVMSTPRHQRPGCFLTALSLALFSALAVLAVAVSAAPQEFSESIHQMVPRQVQVAIASDHVWASVRLDVRPADLGLSSWQRWDLDGSGALGPSEQGSLAKHLCALQTEFLSLMVDGLAVPLSDARLRFDGPPSAPLALEASATLRVEVRADMLMEPGEHRFVFYDLPSDADGIVPIRFTLARGLTLGRVMGARSEKKSERRLEAVVSRASPAVWGSFVREGGP